MNADGEIQVSSTSRTGLSVVVRKRIIRKSEMLITRLIDYQVLKGKFAQLTELEITNVCTLLTDVFSAEFVYLDINLDTPLYILGDIYGQYGDLLRIFNVLGHPPAQRYLFLGNYVDRGNRNVETITLLFAYKLRFPHSIFLLRGNHECEQVSRHFGFYDECSKRFSRRLWKAVVSTFDYMPVAAFIEDKIFCVHSGLSPGIHYSGISTQAELKEYMVKVIPRPTEVSSNVLVTHFLWSDPDSEIKLWEQNPTGMGYLYGPEVVSDFCDRFKLQQIIRSNELIENGYEFFSERRLLTIFSAPNYCGAFRNNGAIVHLKKNVKEGEIKARIKIVKPIMKLRNKMTGRMTIAIEDSTPDVENPDDNMDE